MSSTTSLVRSLARATQNGTTAGERRHELIEQVKKLRSIAEKSASREKLITEFKKFEGMLSEVLHLEQNLSRKESDDVVSLQRQLEEIRKGTMGDGLDKRLDRILFMLSEVGARVDTYTSVKNEQKVRMDQLENNIKESVERNFKEIIQLEKSVATWEQRYNELKEYHDFDQKHLRHIEVRLHNLRGKLFKKKVETTQKKRAEMNARNVGFTINPANELPAPGIISLLPPPSQEDERTDMPLVPEDGGGQDDTRHKVLFPPLPSIQKLQTDEKSHEDETLMDEDLLTDSLPRRENSDAILESEMPPPPGKSRSIFSRLFRILRK